MLDFTDCGRRDSNSHGVHGPVRVTKDLLPAASKAAVSTNSTTPARREIENCNVEIVSVEDGVSAPRRLTTHTVFCPTYSTSAVLSALTDSRHLLLLKCWGRAAKIGPLLYVRCHKRLPA